MAKQSRMGPAPPTAIFHLLVLFVCSTAVTQTAEALPIASQKITPHKQGLQRLHHLGIGQVIFATRLTYKDPHWYANIGYFCDDENEKAYSGDGGYRIASGRSSREY